MIKRFENFDSLMGAKYIHSLWINQNSAVIEEWSYLIVNTRGVFRTQSNICVGDLLKK